MSELTIQVLRGDGAPELLKTRPNSRPISRPRVPASDPLGEEAEPDSLVEHPALMGWAYKRAYSKMIEHREDRTDMEVLVIRNRKTGSSADLQVLVGSESKLDAGCDTRSRKAGFLATEYSFSAELQKRFDTPRYMVEEGHIPS